MLDDFRTHNLINVWWFNQVDGNSVPEYGCKAYTQPGRELYAREIHKAFNTLKNHLNYAPKPTWEVAERIEIRRGSLDNQILCTRYGRIQSFGTRATTEIEKGVSVAYSKSATDSPDNDTATITVTNSSLEGMDPDEVKVYFQVSDGASGDADRRYEITPLSVSISGTTATITGHRANFVKPNGVWAIPYVLAGGGNDEVNTADSSTASDFVTAVDVFREYPNTTGAVQLVDWRGNRSNLTPYIVDSHEGEFTVEMGSSVNLSYNTSHIEVSYFAGEGKTNGLYHPTLIKAVCHLANASIISSQHGQCLGVNNIWLTDNTAYDDESDRDYGFGRKHGQKEAWNIVQEFKEYQGGYS